MNQLHFLVGAATFYHSSIVSKKTHEKIPPKYKTHDSFPQIAVYPSKPSVGLTDVQNVANDARMKGVPTPAASRLHPNPPGRPAM